MPRCLVLQHLELESTYAIGEALDAADIAIEYCRIFADDSLPASLDGFDGLVVMGGPMSATGDEGFPTRRQELTLLAEAVGIGLPTIGVCLGAQLLAAATGGLVRPGGDGLEIGWAPVRLEVAAAADPLLSRVGRELTVFHWHGDTFELPPGAVLLASNARYRHQAFRVGERAWGFQFHLEVDLTAVAAFLDAFGGDLVAARTTAASVLKATPTALAQLEQQRQSVLARFAALVSAAAVGRCDPDVAVGRP